MSDLVQLQQMNDLDVQQASIRQTPRTNFADVMQSGLAKTYNATRALGVGVANYFMPSAAVLSAAVHEDGPNRDTASGGLSARAYSGGVGASGAGLGGAIGGVPTSGGGIGGAGISGGYMDGVLNQANSGNASAQMMAASYQMQEMNQIFNLQYLNLQQNMQNENRQFTALSNVMKAKHETAKNSLSNLK